MMFLSHVNIILLQHVKYFAINSIFLVGMSNWYFPVEGFRNLFCQHRITFLMRRVLKKAKCTLLVSKYFRSDETNLTVNSTRRCWEKSCLRFIIFTVIITFPLMACYHFLISFCISVQRCLCDFF